MKVDGLGLAPDFQRRFFADRDDLVAARWWQESVDAWVPAELGLSRRNWVIVAGGMFALTVVPVVVSVGMPGCDDPEITLDALEAQRARGWNVGASSQQLALAGRSAVDADGRTAWEADLQNLGQALAPGRALLTPFYVPTLFQVLAAPDIRRDLQPIHTAEMDVGRQQGAALVDLFRAQDKKPDTALLIDVPGPVAVAVAAGLAEMFDPVFLFDNWPHPRGVVPSHEVIAAAIYYRPVFERAHRLRAEGAPAFVIDSRRLAPYRDESDAFDNRYLAKLPSAEVLARWGLWRLFYVTDVPRSELDDLNDDFVFFQKVGIEVRMLSLSDFRPDQERTHYVYGGGGGGSHLWFWRSYGTAVSVPAGGPAPPRDLSSSPSYRPQPRPTMFSSRVVGGNAGVGRQKPSGFGRVSLRTSGGSGVVSIGRSGSLGRSGSSFGG